MKFDGQRFNKDNGVECILFFDSFFSKYVWIQDGIKIGLLDQKRYIIESKYSEKYPRFYSFEKDTKLNYDNINNNGFVTI